MTIGGVSIILILGLINLGLLVFQLLTGLRYLKVPFGVHKRSGIILFVFALIHGALGILAGT
ncbi:hypothetical protein ACFL5W_02665 [Thermodesulfobacteriota bacterium]